MAFVAGATKTPGDTITADQWNDYYGTSSSVDALKTEADKIPLMTQTDQTGSRSMNTNYTNASGKIRVITATFVLSGSEEMNVKIQGTAVATLKNSTGGSLKLPMTWVVGLSEVYRADDVGGASVTIQSWIEWDQH